jgi:hypothetical protein
MACSMRWALIALAATGAVGCGGSRPGGSEPEPRAAAPRTDLPGRSDSHRVCSARRPCWYVGSLAQTASLGRDMAHETTQRFRAANPAAVLVWADGRPVPANPIGSAGCGVHFVLGGRVVGWAEQCGSAAQTLRFRFTNVSRKPVRLVVQYFATPTGPTA